MMISVHNHHRTSDTCKLWLISIMSTPTFQSHACIVLEATFGSSRRTMIQSLKRANILRSLLRSLIFRLQCRVRVPRISFRPYKLSERIQSLLLAHYGCPERENIASSVSLQYSNLVQPHLQVTLLSDHLIGNS